MSTLSEANRSDEKEADRLPDSGTELPRLDIVEVNKEAEEDLVGYSIKTSRTSLTTSRATFSRTPSNMIAQPEDEDSEEDEHTHSSVLITELQIEDAETRDEVNQEDVEKQEVDSLYDQLMNEPVRKGDIKVILYDDKPEEFYETDLESEAEEEEDFVISYYKTVCEQLGQVPVAYFLHRIREPTIRMRYRGLGNEATKAIALALKESVTLERLDLSGNWIGPDGANSMARLLEENDYVTDVILSDNKMGSEGGEQIAKMLNINCGLRRLELSGNDFDDKCAQNFALAIENNKYLRELNLSHNRFTELGAEYLGQAIGSNENLDVLDLSWNHIREAGGIAIAKGLKENVRLKVCNLSWNGLGVKGGLALVDAMSSNQSITELDISGNRFTQEVATGFAKVLSTNDTMKILRMGNNLITSAGALALATGVNNAQHCEMEELDLTDVPVEYEFLRTIEDVKSTRPNFRVKHGPIMRAGNTLQDISSPAIDVEKIKKEPVVLLKEHIIVNDFRLLDILKRYDESSTLSISAEDFIAALEELAVPYDKKRLESSVKAFAATSTGKIYFGSFVSAEHKKQMAEQEKVS
ncbi:leucine-rich repeat-containing protein 74B [Biomphalaria pfeifferi]|uniref:Leucine-rich repeat-containing protein 74B n=1 Tax=Biomphalaria pfeifferi TaxID=112525 RepID=A0AAD8BQJ2_BIOPF|nr:leucine-rich repeat-containing protein 74B [Biomphalaria pfeifferi]